MQRSRRFAPGLVLVAFLVIPSSNPRCDSAIEIAPTPCVNGEGRLAEYSNRRLIQSVLCIVLDDVSPFTFAPRDRHRSAEHSMRSPSLAQTTAGNGAEASAFHGSASLRSRLATTSTDDQRRKN